MLDGLVHIPFRQKERRSSMKSGYIPRTYLGAFMKLFLPLVLAFSFSMGSSAFAAKNLLACAGDDMVLTVNFQSGLANFWNAQGSKIASDSVMHVTQFAVRSPKAPAQAYVINFKKYGLLKAQIRDVTSKGFAELDHEGQFTNDETGGEEIVSFACALTN